MPKLKRDSDQPAPPPAEDHAGRLKVQPLARGLPAEHEEDATDLGNVLTESRPDPSRTWPKQLPNSVFWFVASAHRWDALEDGAGGRVILPILSKLSATPGVNGVLRVKGADGKNAADVRPAFEQLRQDPRLTLIPHDVDGPRTSYVRKYRCGTVTDIRSGAPVPVFHWVSRFERCYPASDLVTADTAGYTAWLSSLVERGFLPLCPVNVLDELEGRYIQRLDKVTQSRAMANPGHPLINSCKSALESIKAARARLMAAIDSAGPADEVDDQAEDLAGVVTE